MRTAIRDKEVLVAASPRAFAACVWASGQGRHDLLEVLDDRYARRGTLLASQLPIDHWHDVLGDPTFGDAILDRGFSTTPIGSPSRALP